jgi:hypothetical protein
MMASSALDITLLFPGEGRGPAMASDPGPGFRRGAVE